MKGYVYLHILLIPKPNLSAYRRVAKRWGEIIRDHGVLEYREFLGDDLKMKHVATFSSKKKLKPSEVLISSVVEFRSKSHHNQVNTRAMNDLRMKRLITDTIKKPLFDMKRMFYDGFSTIVKMRGN